MFHIFTIELFIREQTGNKLILNSAGWVSDVAAVAHCRLNALQSTLQCYCGKVFTIFRELIKASIKTDT